MYLSADRLAIANRAVQETFEQTSVAWQAIPHWDVGDPGASTVRNDIVNAPGFCAIDSVSESFQATLAQLGAPTPDSLLAAVMTVAGRLAGKVDRIVLDAIRADPEVIKNTIVVTAVTPEGLMDHLIDGRAQLEDAGYRAPSCLVTNTEGLKKLSAFSSGSNPVTDSILSVVNVNSLHRATQLGKAPSDSDANKIMMLLIGRRQRIADGAAADASPGEEPVDLAVSVPPGLRVVGEDSTGNIENAVRIGFATRIKDGNGVVVLEQS